MKFIYYSPRFYSEVGITRAGRKANNEQFEKLLAIQEMAISRQENYYAVEDTDLTKALSLGAKEVNTLVQAKTPCAGCKHLYMPKIGDVYVLPFDELRYTKSGNILVVAINSNHKYQGLDGRPFHYFVDPDGKYLGYCSPAQGEHLRTVCPLITLNPMPFIETAVSWDKVETLMSLPEDATTPMEDCNVFKAVTASWKTILLIIHPGDQHHELSTVDYWRLRQSDYYCEYTQQWVEVRPTFGTLRKRYKALGELGVAQLHRELRKRPKTRTGRQPGKR